MKIKLTARGGMYGTLQLEPIDTDAENVDFPLALIDLIRSTSLQAFQIDADNGPGDEGFETEQQRYELEVSDAGNDQQFLIPHSALDADENVKALIDGIWSRAKPVPQ